MNQYFLCQVLAIGSLTIFSPIESSVTKMLAQPLPITQHSLALSQEVDYKIMVEQLFKKSKIEDKWFTPASPSQRTGRNARLLELKKKSVQYFGKYRSVRNEGKNYIATFERGEVILAFILDREQRIAGISAKPK